MNLITVTVSNQDCSSGVAKTNKRIDVYEREYSHSFKIKIFRLYGQSHQNVEEQ